MKEYDTMKLLYPITRRFTMQVLTYRLSIFGDFKHFAPTPENTIAWTQGFKDAGYELIPSVIQSPQAVIAVPFLTVQQGTVEKRMQFSSTDGSIIVRFLSERMDIEFTQGVSVQFDKYFVDSIPNARSLFSVALNLLKNTKGTRLAYFTDILIEEHKPNCFASLYSDNAGISLNNYEGEYIEWSHRFNKRITLDISQNKETINTILQLESGTLQTIMPTTGAQQVIKGLHVATDINTLAETAMERFDNNDALEFFTKAQEVFLDMLSQIMSKTV